jgi:hypothetical protein
LAERPVSFGYKIGWLAVREQPPEAVAAAVGMTDPVPATWDDGVAAAYDGSVFATPPVKGWTLVVSTVLLEAAMRLGWPEWLERLSAKLGEVQRLAATKRSRRCRKPSCGAPVPYSDRNPPRPPRAGA